MTSLFDARERAFEAKWAHDEEMQFRVIVRRNELLGRWLAEELGLAGADKERYVAALIALGLKGDKSDALFQKVRADLGEAHSSTVILRRMDDFLRAASLDVGLEQRHLLDEGTAPDLRGRRGHWRINFVHMLEQGEGDAGRDEGSHARMLRKISGRGAG